MAAGIAALAATGVGAPAAATILGTVAAVAGAVTAVDNISERQARNTLAWDAEMALDILSIAGVIPAASGLKSARVAALGINSPQTLRTARLLGIYGFTETGLTAVLMPVKLQEDIQKIKELDLPPGQEKQLINKLKEDLAGSAFMMLAGGTVGLATRGPKDIPAIDSEADLKRKATLLDLEGFGKDYQDIHQRNWIDGNGSWTENAPLPLKLKEELKYVQGAISNKPNGDPTIESIPGYDVAFKTPDGHTWRRKDDGSGTWCRFGSKGCFKSDIPEIGSLPKPKESSGDNISSVSKIMTSLEQRSKAIIENSTSKASGEHKLTSEYRKQAKQIQTEIDEIKQLPKSERAARERELTLKVLRLDYQMSELEIALKTYGSIDYIPKRAKGVKPLKEGESKAYINTDKSLGKAKRKGNRISVETTLKPAAPGSPLPPRRDYEEILAPSGEDGIARLHAAGRIVRHESPFGILHGPQDKVNVALQSAGIEDFVSRITEQGADDVLFHLRVEVERFPGDPPFLREATYVIEAQRLGSNRRTKVFETAVTVEGKTKDSNAYAEVKGNLSSIEEFLKPSGRRPGTEVTPDKTRPKRSSDVNPKIADKIHSQYKELLTRLRRYKGTKTLATMLNDQFKGLSNSGQKLTQDDMSNLYQHIHDLINSHLKNLDQSDTLTHELLKASQNLLKILEET